MVVKSFREMLNRCCGDCEWFNPYEGYDEPREAGPGECWRFPQHKDIDCGNSYHCGEWTEKVDGA